MVAVATESWILVALLLHEHPDRQAVRPRDVIARARHEQLHDTIRPGLQQHLSTHAVANRAASPNTYRLLFATEDGQRRLYRTGDFFDPSRSKGKTVPTRLDVPPKYHYLLDWYGRDYNASTSSNDNGLGESPLGNPIREGITVPRFMDLVDHIRASYISGAFEYVDPDTSFCSIARAAFDDCNSVPDYGVYIVWCIRSGVANYLGKAGTIAPSGSFKGQGLLGRLCNVRGDNMQADEYFRLLALKAGSPLKVEYFVINEKPISPALLEALLLQAYLNEYGSLPMGNSAF